MELHPEDTPRPQGFPVRVVRLLAGFEVGFYAGLLPFAWILLHSWMRGEPWWAKLNVAGALFFGDRIYGMGLSLASLAGGSLILLSHSLVGLVFGQLARVSGFIRNLVWGVALSLGWGWLCHTWVLPRVDPFAQAYFPQLAMIPAQMMYGIGLSLFALRFEALARVFGDPSWASVYDVEDEVQLVEALPEVPPPVTESEESPPRSEGDDCWCYSDSARMNSLGLRSETFP